MVCLWQCITISGCLRHAKVIRVGAVTLHNPGFPTWLSTHGSDSTAGKRFQERVFGSEAF
jgi:hypothetical protein